MDLLPVDWAVIGVYLVAVLVVGFWFGRHERDAEDYFLAARRLPWYLIGLSLYASNMSGASFVGLTGAAYEHGLTVFNYEWTAALVLVLFALFMLPVFLRARLFTVPEYLEARFDRRSRWIYAAFTILTLMFIDTAGALYAGGVVVRAIVPEWELWQITAAIAVFTGAYTLFGGLRAVVVTDALQAVLVIAGATLIVVLGLEEVGGWNALTAALEPAHTQLIKPAGDPFLPWPGVVEVVLLGFYYWTLNQYFVQRVLAARSLDEGRKGALFGGLLKLPNVFLMIVPGMIAVALMPDIANPDGVFAALAFELLPAGLRGLVLVALLAAIMSSLDSALNAAASMLTMDFVRPLRPATSGPALLAIGRIFTGVLIAAAAVYAPLIERFGSLFVYFQSTLAYLVPPVVAVYLGGLFIRRMTAAGAFWAILAGLGVGATLFVAKEVTGTWSAAGLPALHYAVMAVVMFVFALFVMTAVSLAGPAPAPVAAVYRRGDVAPEPGAPGRFGWGDYRLQAAALALLIVGILAVLS